jgi:hypothetical protein
MKKLKHMKTIISKLPVIKRAFVVALILFIGISLKAQETIITKRGLVAYYPFNGNANDESGNNNNGKISGATFIADKIGRPTKALYFDGMDNCVEIPYSPAINITGSISISCWIYPHSAENYTSWIAKANNNRKTSQWRFGFGNSGTELWGLTIWNSDWHEYYTNKKPIQLNTWSHVLFIADQEKHIAYLYLNGELIDTKNDIKEFQGSTDPLFIGRQMDDDVYFDGLIDEVRIYDRTLSTDEVKELYKQFNQ